jgi:hypothetical protein
MSTPQVPRKYLVSTPQVPRKYPASTPQVPRKYPASTSSVPREYPASTPRVLTGGLAQLYNAFSTGSATRAADAARGACSA